MMNLSAKTEKPLYNHIESEPSPFSRLKPEGLCTHVNFVRPPYGKELPASYRIQIPDHERQKDLQKDVDISFDTYLECFNDYKTGKMTEKEERYKLYGVPGPSQYKAFSEFFKFFSEDEFEFKDRRIFCYYDIAKMDKLAELANIEALSEVVCVLKFLDNLTKFDFSGQKQKKVVYCSGSFWKKIPNVRVKVISQLETLEQKGVNVQMFTNAEITEDHMDRISHLAKKTKSRFGLKKRIPIHFIQCADECYFINFPHTEYIVTRLNMFLDLNEDYKYKSRKSKADVVQFFDRLIKRALW